jgi:ABC-type taurine transport system substrate-binding protein
MSEYILKTREDREKHIDLTSDCILTKSYDWKNPVKRAVLQSQLGVVRDVNMVDAKVCCRHLCTHNTEYAKEHGVICMNPLHVAIGTYAENKQDSFGWLAEGDPVSRLNNFVGIKLPDNLYSWVKDQSEGSGATVSDVIRACINESRMTHPGQASSRAREETDN